MTTILSQHFVTVIQITEYRGTERQKCVAQGRGIYDVYESQLMNEEANFSKLRKK